MIDTIHSNRPRRALRPLATAMLIAAAVTTAAAAGAQPANAPGHDTAARSYFTDVVLINQDGREMRLYSDLLKDRVVIISAMFTDCEGVCPVTMGNLKKIQKWLGPRLGDDVHLLSLTVDRKTDSPERLKQYAESFKAGQGWHFLTGTPENIDFALRKLGLWVQNREGHASQFLIGNVPTGLWKKAHGMADIDSLLEIVDSVLDDRLKTHEEEEPQAGP